MAEPQKVTIALDDSFTASVCDYSVGFLKFRMEGRQEVAAPAGTGTFVKLGRVYGILTAGHVLKELDPQSTVGLVRFPSVQPPIQNRRLNLQHTERLVNWNEKECDAPDIGFLKIPELDGRELEAAGAVFYNLGISREYKASKPEHRMSVCHAVVGVVGEWTEKVPALFTKGLKVVVGGLFGAAKNLRNFKEGDTDLIEAEISHGPRIPKSHGGVSGGALWELHVELDEKLQPVKPVNKRLVGVVFRQSGDHTKVTSNGTPSIDAVVEAMRQKWPDVSKDN
jgi:hypothetical protein